MALRIPFIAFLLLTGGAHALAIVANPPAVTRTTQANVTITAILTIGSSEVQVFGQ